MKHLVARTLARLIPSNYIENRISEWVSKQSGEGRWTTLLNTGSNTSKLGSTSQQLEAYQSHVYKCVNLIKNRVQSLSWKLVYRQGNEEQDVDQHIFYDLALTPNQIWSMKEMIGFAMMHLDLTGRAFWKMELNGLGKPIGFVPMLPSLFIDLKLASDGVRIESYKFYSYEQGQKKWTIKTYRSEEIVDFRYQHPVELLGGASPIQQMAYAYDTDLAIRIQQRNFFENSARPDLVFETEQRPNTDAIDRFLMRWNEAHQGVENKWQPAVLGGGMSAKVLNISNVDLELMNLMKFTKRDILEAYHVPEGKLGTVEDINRANQLGVDIQFNEECIWPRLTIFDEVISGQILSLYDPRLHWVYENPIPKDKEARAKIRNDNLKNQYSSINEEREIDGKEPVSWGDTPWISFNLIQIGTEIKPTKPTEPAKDGKHLKWTGYVKFDRDHFFARHGRKIDAQSKGIHGFFKRLFKDLRTEVNENLRRIWPRIEGVTNGLSVKKANRWIENNKDLITEGNFDLEAAAKRIEDEGMIYVEQILIESGNDAIELLGIADLEFDIASPFIQEYLDIRKNLLVDVTEDIFEQIMEEIKESISLGESVGQMQSRLIENVWTNAEQVRALKVARTEAGTGINRGNLEGYKQAGVERKSWINGFGARDSHAAAGARYSEENAIPINEGFEVGSGRGPCPGNIGIAAEDINCRCTILPIISD